MPCTVVEGRKVYYELHGSQGGTPLVLVMGMGGSCRGWLPLQVPDFSAARRTLIFENRGVGESEDPGGPFSTAQLADDTAGLLDALEIEQADVLGAFMGGMICQELALRHPERVRRMVLEQWRDLALEGAPTIVMVRERLLWTLQEETLEQHDLIESMLEFFARGGAPLSPDLFGRQCDACIHHDTSGRLSEISQPTLVVCGRHDVLTPPRFQRQLADQIPDAHLVTITSAAHLVMMESAQHFNHAVLQFLA
jgi:pimeloyl-ACP methyl ester carboxylesterase